MSARDAYINTGIRIGLDYAAEFLAGAANAAVFANMPVFAEAFKSASDELRNVDANRVPR